MSKFAHNRFWLLDVETAVETCFAYCVDAIVEVPASYRPLFYAP